MMMLYKPFDIGDEVKLNGIWGYVDSINLASTKIKGFQGQIFNIPNNVVWGGTIETLTQSKNRKIQIWLRVEFSENLEYIEQLLIEIMKSHPKILQSPSPSTFVWQIEKYYISVSISGWTTKEDYWTVHADYIRLIQERFIKEGISVAAIPLHKEILIRQTSSTTSQDISSEISNSPQSEIPLEI
jgi:small conductance mechanosensitive channel